MKSVIWCAVLLGLSGIVGSASAEQSRGRGGPPSFDTLLSAFDSNNDEALSSDEVPPPVWRRLSNADANEDGSVTRDEFEAARKTRGGM